MPIRLENKDRYPKDWKAISRRIREQAGNVCQQCRAPNGVFICRGEGADAGTYMLENGEVRHEQDGLRLGRAKGSEYQGRFVRVVLTVAHLDHTPENCADENLRAWCQRCHNAYDAPMRKRGIAERAKASRAAADLFA